MPTDPFVAPDLDDKPRQQQNLPPGLGYPPARSWRADRPGDLVAGRSSSGQSRVGTLRGTPGPRAAPFLAAAGNYAAVIFSSPGGPLSLSLRRQFHTFAEASHI